MQVPSKHFEILAEITLYPPDRGRLSPIRDGYRPSIFFGLSDPIDPHYASDSIVKLINQTEICPGQTAFVKIYIIKYFYLRQLLLENTKLKIKEGRKFVGEGKIVNVIGER